MKKLLILILVLAMASLAGATTVYIVEPATGAPGSAADPLAAGESLSVYLGVDAGDLDTLSVTVSVTNATITGGILASEAPQYGAWGIDLGTSIMYSGGWQTGLSNDTAIIGGAAHIGMGMFGNTIYTTALPVDAPPLTPGGGGSTGTPIAYIDITATGTGEMGRIGVSLVNGSIYGESSWLTDLETVPDFVGIIPEPATLLLLGLGGLVLRKKQ